MINGYQNEHEFSKYLNARKVKFLNPLFKELIFSLFSNVLEDDVIRSYVDYENKKYDIVISINDVCKRLSIKKGMKNSVHVEGISSFVSFLKECNVDKGVIDEYLKYHFADGSIDGTGRYRVSAEKYKEANQWKVDYINEKINTDKILKKIVYRFILQGRNSKDCIDGLIYGYVDDFIFLSPDDIINIILSKKDVYSTGVHFSSLTCQPMNRCLNYNKLYESKRYCVQMKWYNLFDDAIEYKNSLIIKKEESGF